MGKSHYRSNIIGRDSNFVASMATITASDLRGNVTASAPTVHGTTSVRAGSYVRIGTAGYLFFSSTNAGFSATIVAEATALVATPIVGSLTLSNAGQLWIFDSDTTATKAF